MTLRSFSRLVVLAIAAAVCLVAWPADAQVQRAERPYRGLFGGNEADPASRQALDFSAGLNFGYDDNVSGTGSVGGSFDPRFQASSRYVGGSVSLAYAFHGNRVSVAASGNTSGRLLTEVDDLVTLNHGAAAGAAVRLGPRTGFSINQSVAFSPYYSFSLLPPLFLPEIGEQAPFGEDFVVQKREAWRYGTSLGLNHQLSPRTSVSAGYGLNYTDFVDAGRDLRYHRARAGLVQRLTRYASLRLGYGYGRGEFAQGDSASSLNEHHNIDVGVDYARSLSFSRSTTFSFSTGSSVLKSQNRTFARLSGNANLAHQMGRSWSLYASYQRGLAFRDGFDEPLWSDSVLTGLNGYLGSRTRVSLAGGYSTGSVGARRGRGYDTMHASASLQYAVTRFVAAVANYGLYRYGFDQARDLPSGVPQELDRHAFRVGLSFWVPLLR